MVSFKPTQQQLDSLVDMGSLLAVAGLSTATQTSGPPDNPVVYHGDTVDFLAFMDVAPEAHFRVFAMLSEQDLGTYLPTWQPNGGAPRLAALAAVKTAWTIARCVLGFATWPGEPAPHVAASTVATPTASASAASAPSLLNTPVIRINEFTDQGSSDQITYLAAPELLAAHAEYIRLMEEPPDEDVAVTAEQLSAVQYQATQGRSMYLDFAIWGPYATRMARKQLMTGLMFDQGGLFHKVEMYGPKDFPMWLDCYDTMCTAFLSLKLMRRPTLKKYRKMMMELASQFGPAVWPLLYQTDVRTRAERWTSLLAALQLKHNAMVLKAAATSTPLVPSEDVNFGFDPKMPWNAVMAASIADGSDKWWDRQFKTPSLIILAKAGQLQHSLGGDARVSTSSTEAAQARVISDFVGKNSPLAIEDAQPARHTTPRPRAKAAAAALVAQAVNAKGHEICRGFQSGSCSKTVHGNKCPKDNNRVHVCDQCLSSAHGSSHPKKCTAAPPAKKQRRDSNVDSFDILRTPAADLTDDACWTAVLQNTVKGFYAGKLYFPPSSTFRGARSSNTWGSGGGAVRLRGRYGAERYGARGLSKDAADKVRTGTYLAVMTAKSLDCDIKHRTPFLLLTPDRSDDASPTILDLDEFKPVLSHAGVKISTLHHCSVGGKTAKPFLVLSFLVPDTHDRLTPARAHCNHACRSWTIPWSGQTFWRAHPPLRGRAWAIPTDRWRKSMLTAPPPRTVPLLTQRYKRSPSKLERVMAKLLTRAVRKPYHASPARDLSAAVLPASSLASSDPEAHARVGLAAPLRQEQSSARIPVQALGGLRQTAATMSRLPHKCSVEALLHTAFAKALAADPSVTPAVLSHIGLEIVKHLDEKLVKPFRKIMWDVLLPLVPGFKPRVGSEDCVIERDLLDLWRQAAKDPDWAAVAWLFTGAPAGILNPIEDCGIFPLYSPDEDYIEVDPADLQTAWDFTNYAGVEADADAATEMDRITSPANGFVQSYDTWEEVANYLGEDPVLSKIGLIKRIRNGKLKTRLVIDSKQNGVSRACRKYERSCLPKVIHAVYDFLDLAAKAKTSQTTVEFLVADFSDAFFIVPNSKNERKFFVVRFRNKYYVFLKTTQGSRGAPLTWSRLAALLTRLTMSVIDYRSSRICTYVDDPLVMVLGDQAFRDRTFAITLLLWSCLHFPLSLAKASRGKDMTWIAGHLQSIPGGLAVGVKKDIITDVLKTLSTFLKANVISIKDLHTFASKMIHIASLVYTINPFLSELHAAIYADPALSKAPAGCVWTKQISTSLHWIHAFLTGSTGELTRRYTIAAYAGRGNVVEVNLDASPWGMGGYLCINNVIASWFATPLTVEEALLLGITIGDAASQQAVEALAALIALRAWCPHWKEHGACLRVRSDSISALVLVLRLKTKGRATGIIAREVALDIAAACYEPTLAEHVPGLANVTCDVLSRKFQPVRERSRQPWRIPRILAGVEPVSLPIRDGSYYRSLGSPPGAH